jgi:hypothetical protein
MPHRSLLESPHFEAATMGDTVAGAADYRGQPASRAATGGWKSSIFVMGTPPISCTSTEIFGSCTRRYDL